jgi:hypothetical protein
MADHRPASAQRRRRGLKLHGDGVPVAHAPEACIKRRLRSTSDMTHVLASLFAIALALWAAEVPADDTAVDVELIIANDVSGSMDSGEQVLVRQGYISAFTDEDLIAAITAGRYHRIAIAIIEWAGLRDQTVIVPWMLVDGAKSAAALGSALEASVHRVGKATSISAALIFSAGLFAGDGYISDRRVIDISGDGVNNVGRPVEEARDLVVKQGITINGLPIVLDRSDPAIEAYYRNCVIGGPRAFAMAINKVGDFDSAIRQKLLREILFVRGKPSQQADGQVLPQTDCLIGEHQVIPHLQ